MSFIAKVIVNIDYIVVDSVNKCGFSSFRVKVVKWVYAGKRSYVKGEKK